MNTLKILSSLLQFRNSPVSVASLDSLVAGVIEGFDSSDGTIKTLWESWGNLPYDPKEYKKGWKKAHNTGRLPPQMVAKNARGQRWDLVEREVDRLATNPTALWGRQQPNQTFLKQSERVGSSPELNSSRALNNQRVAFVTISRPVPDLEPALFDKIENEV